MDVVEEKKFIEQLWNVWEHCTSVDAEQDFLEILRKAMFSPEHQDLTKEWVKGLRKLF